ncbi:MAG: xanthine dehydrogenase accessory protein XdhC [Fulvimarina manganoxydans]|uniref:xanthine dehydrogenase accessory protein XdhC n=1 Tax=Fulvimarina manganoxydans TaxID=937218 RepID=UPI0023529A19|nr:xanthine dehydrogenase accessory protein XdhC [Fulvimarina manganoxydans]MCK5932719.1 xanthine dehydrogenase accessory protein XdhC [Fulvimarina manganoxydans]
MGRTVDGLERFLSENRHVILVALTKVRGSSPRETGTQMFVSAGRAWGTIGGGQLEFRAVEAARAMLRDGHLSRVLDLPLGPEIGQCCGGRVVVSLKRMRASDRRTALSRADNEAASRPHVYVMGAGHVGRALADLMQHCPVRCILVDPRPEEVALCEAAVETRISAIPEVDVMTAPKGSAFIVLTHDHGLDFLIAAAALERGDAAYVGMIGSATKRVKMRNWMREHGNAHAFDRLVCPIGANGSRDKRPSVIAAFVVAEVMATLTAKAAAAVPHRPSRMPETGGGAGPAEARA